MDKLETQIKTHHSDTAFIRLTPTSPTDETFSGPVIVFYYNPSLGGLSDFVPHHNLFIFTNFQTNDALVALIETIRSYFLTDMSLRGTGFELKSSLISGPRISLRLHIGSVFSVPVCTVHVMNLVLITERLPSMLAPIEPEPFIYNAKPVGPYNRLDLMMELWMQSDAAAANEDPYAEVNAVVARGINELCVKRFATEQPNAVIQQLHGAFMEVTDPKNTHLVGTRLIKNALIAILQNPAVQTTEQMKFSDIFPSGQYGAYFDELAHRCDTVRAVGPLMVRIGEGEDSFPLSRTDIIVAALTAVNAAMQSADTGEGEGTAGMGHIVVGGGAAVSHYIQDFLQSREMFNADAAVVQNMDQLTERCRKIRMNDIDCFVFGDVPRQFLLLFSIYMMIMYDNFYERPKRYNQRIAESQVAKMRFKLSSESDDHIDLFMYGNRKNDANTQLISKRLQKNPKVQIVTQETKCFSQIVHPVCSFVAKGEGEGEGEGECKDDSYHMQPIDLVKKDLQEFIDLYRISLYTPDQIPPPDDLEAMVRRQYTSDNMVSMKTVMLDLICIFCDEGQSLFIRIFMARKNPKDFARLRVFIDVYLLYLMRSNGEAFAAVKDDFIAAVERLRDKMEALNTKYYLEQGNIAAINAETAAQVTQDRADFLTLLRDIGRRVVALPDPLDDRVPVKFQSVIGANTVAFFKKNRTMKYRFNMNLHMKELVSLYQGMDATGLLSQAHATQCRAWLDRVFSRIKFSTDAEAFFESKLEQAISPVNPDGNRKIGFKDMPIRSSFMLRLHDALKSVRAHEDVFRKFSEMFTDMLRPIREHVARYGMLPTAQYVGIMDGVYDTNEKRRLFPTLVRDVFLSEEVKRNPENMDASIMLTELNRRTNVYDKYDDVVKEEIGRILLEYARDYMGKLRGGGKTRRKRQGQRMLHAKTRSSREKGSAATRKRRPQFRMKHRHTRTRG